MKTRRHHNNKGFRGIRTGSYTRQMKRLARKLKIRFVIGKGRATQDTKGKAG